MTDTNPTWEHHEAKAEQALIEARHLLAAQFYDGACSRALASFVHVAKAVAIRLRKEGDRNEWMASFRLMTRDGRLPSDFIRPFDKIVAAHLQDIELSRPREAKEAQDFITLAETFARVALSASEVSESAMSKVVQRAAARRGIEVPRFF